MKLTHLKKRENSRMTKEIGCKIRTLRQIAGLSQEKLAERLGVTPQQVQKYEAAKTRIPTERLQQIANVLQVHIAEFFHDDHERLVLNQTEETFVHKLRRVRNQEARRSLMVILDCMAR